MGEISSAFSVSYGAGRSEFAQVLFGRRRPTGGTIRVSGERFTPRSERQSIGRGFALVPESRRIQGLCLNQSVGFNLNLAAYRPISPAGIVSPVEERKVAQDQIRALKIATPGPGAEVLCLSGGNHRRW